MSRFEQRRATQAKVMAAAGHLFRERGFAETTVRDIAAACDVSVGTVMAVGDKNVLLLGSFDQLIADIHEGRMHSARAGDDCAGQIVGLFAPFVEAFANHPALARAYGSILVTGAYDSIVFTDLAQQLIQEIDATLRASDVENSRIPALAQGIYFAYIGRLFTWSSDDANPAAALKQSLHQIVEAICPGKE